MKTILSAGVLLSASLLLLTGCRSIEKATAEQMKHEWTREYPGISRDVIFDRAVRWTVQSFRSGGRVIRTADKKTGTIVADGIRKNVFLVLEERTWVDGDMKFTMTLDIRDGAARFSYTFKVLTDGGKENRDAVGYEKINLAAHRELEAITEAITNAVTRQEDFR